MSHVARAASVLLARDPHSPELFTVQRSPRLRFFGGLLAFAGGKVAPADRTLRPLGAGRLSADMLERRLTAARETFEETGVLLARYADRTFPQVTSALRYLRRKMIDEDWPFARVLERARVAVHAEDFIPLGSLTTPPFVPTRFDTQFFLAFVPPGQEPEVWPGELEYGQWTTADRALTEWRQGQRLISPPTILIFETVRGQPAREFSRLLAPAMAAHDSGALPPIFFAPDVQLLPLETQALPPSTHTNAYLVGRAPAYLLDPGPVAPDEQERLFAALDARVADGLGLAALVLSHHHPDHVGAAGACAARYRVPVLAHPATIAKLEGKIRVDRALACGERLDLGRAPDGTGSWFLEAIGTPGHAPGHLAFFEPRYRLLFAGDMISTLSSVVIAPPDGDLALYLQSLERLRHLDSRLLLPSHGSPTARPREVIDEALAHRARREEQLLAALGREPKNVAELARELYRGLAPALFRFAEWQIRAGLQKLQREGRAETVPAAEGEAWRRKT